MIIVPNLTHKKHELILAFFSEEKYYLDCICCGMQIYTCACWHIAEPVLQNFFKKLFIDLCSQSLKQSKLHLHFRVKAFGKEQGNDGRFYLC